MIPYGKKKKSSRNYPDNHPPKGWVNWWEYELDSVEKGRARQEGKRGVRKQMEIDLSDDILEMEELDEELNYLCSLWDN